MRNHSNRTRKNSRKTSKYVMKAGNPTRNKTQKQITKIQNKIMTLETKYQKKENKYDEFKEKHQSKALEERLLGEELDRLEEAGKEANKKQIDKLQKKYDKLGSIVSKEKSKMKREVEDLDDITIEIERLKDEMKELENSL